MIGIFPEIVSGAVRYRFGNVNAEAFECIGSMVELKERAGFLPMRDNEVDLHKPYIDELTMECKACGKR